MATWQYDITMIPSRSIDLETFKKEVSCIVPPTSSWSDSILIWGEIDGDRIDMFVDAETHEISVRFDMRQPNADFFRNILSLAVKYGCEIRNDKDEVLMTTSDEVASDMMDSDAFRFVANPHEFISGVKTEKGRE